MRRRPILRGSFSALRASFRSFGAQVTPTGFLFGPSGLISLLWSSTTPCISKDYYGPAGLKSIQFQCHESKKKKFLWKKKLQLDAITREKIGRNRMSKLCLLKRDKIGFNFRYIDYKNTVSFFIIIHKLQAKRTKECSLFWTKSNYISFPIVLSKTRCRLLSQHLLIICVGNIYWRNIFY